MTGVRCLFGRPATAGAALPFAVAVAVAVAVITVDRPPSRAGGFLE